jgi:hypothetical protein
MSRKRSCEICGVAVGMLSNVDGGTRRVTLCAAHAADVALAGVASVEALRALFIETGGRRALLSRRADERRLFPPRPEGRRLSRGRRKSDAPRPRQRDV